MRHIIPISGKDSLATAIWQTAHEPELPYEFVYNDTRAELPETYVWLARVEETLGIKILRIGKSLKEIISDHGILPSARIRFCTRDAKIRPMNRFIGTDTAVVYFGLRADEHERLGALETKKLLPRYPLRDAGIGLATVYRIVESRDLLPPAFFWSRLFVEVIDKTGGLHGIGMKIVNEWPQWTRDRVFAWRSRPNSLLLLFPAAL
jgi:Phosphoadenosine phosphosulfate reductase family